jgi:transcriptional regulator with XRE-family HTH domain
MSEAFPARLRRLRQQRRLTQHDLADACGLTQATISRLETGKHSPTWSAVCALADALGCTTDALRPRTSTATTPHTP